MDVTTAMLADFAQVREGLLFVASGGVTRCYRDQLPAPLGVFLATVLELDRLEAERVHEVHVVVVDEDGQQLAEIAGEIQLGATAADDQREPQRPDHLRPAQRAGRAVRLRRDPAVRGARAPAHPADLGAAVRARPTSRARRLGYSGSGTGCGGGGPT